MIKIIAEINADIKAIKEDVLLRHQTNFDARANAIDFIDFHIIDRLNGLLIGAEEFNILTLRAEKLKYELEQIDIKLFEQFRENIKVGSYNPTSFRETINQYFGYDINTEANEPGYDNLDTFINGLLCYQTLPDPTLANEPEMVFYQQTPARVILQLAAQITKDDVFFDLGSGLGQVSILIHLLTGAIAKGIEYEPAYCSYAATSALQLNLPQIDFINIDARNADYTAGTVFFMYTPFTGNLLQEVLELLRNESLKRTIRIFTYGPCSSLVAQQSWLYCVNGEANDLYKLCEFKNFIAP